MANLRIFTSVEKMMQATPKPGQNAGDSLQNLAPIVRVAGVDWKITAEGIYADIGDVGIVLGWRLPDRIASLVTSVTIMDTFKGPNRRQGNYTYDDYTEAILNRRENLHEGDACATYHLVVLSTTIASARVLYYLIRQGNTVGLPFRDWDGKEQESATPKNEE